MPRLEKLRVIYAILFAMSVGLYLYEELHLRRWLYQHGGHGSVVAGSLPDFLAVLLLGLGAAVLRLPDDHRDTVRLALAVVAGLVLYEVSQIWMPHQVFDWNDIAATLLGGVVLWAVVRIASLSLRR